ncbi:GTP-binding protein [Streptosporangium lutulentum]|uniref:G3E family GTPase n=1 Tax=Streptosporangium lutulentum TaxID=1461250 RepID=A0ABT9QT78_9ACTN|nr:GTP-binding protein [Streptosporangium lutulentum]MDP9849972.1 G3E family GTPase [Streptosporangium lutulentum]
MSTPVVLVAGLHAQARATVVDRLLEDHPGAVAIHHDLREVTRGRVERVTRDASDVLDRTEVRLAHGCVTCTVREDLVPELLRHAATAPLLIAELWDSVEPRSVAEALDGEEVHGTLRLTAVLTALDAEHMPVDICRGDRLAETGMRAASGDERYLAEVLARQIEYATGLLLHLGDGDDEDVELSRAVLGHLAPNTPAPLTHEPLPIVTGPALCVQELAARVDPATAQLPCDARTGEISTVVWHRLRPLHPGRLFEAAWEMVSPARQMAASLDWSPILGDRVQHLVFTGPELDHDRIHSLLDSCLLTPAIKNAREMALLPLSPSSRPRSER